MTEAIAALPAYAPVRIEEDGERMYSTPVGKVPSVTTVLSGSRDNSGLELWRESVGIERADFIRDLAAHRGTAHHTNIENYLRDGEEPQFNFLTTPYWRSTETFIKAIRRPLVMEGAIWHPRGFAGTFDCIAYLPEDDDQPTMLDWKTADKLRTPDKMYDYSLQVAAYVAAANHVYSNYGLNITTAKVVVALPCQTPQIEHFDEDALRQLFQHFLARLERFTYYKK